MSDNLETQTAKNLMAAFLGESQARNRYTMFAKVAKKEGYELIAGIFAETADQEAEHAKLNYKMLVEDLGINEAEITIEFGGPVILTDTAKILQSAIDGEHYENTIMYPEFANTAQKEGFPKVAVRLRGIGRAEWHHEQRYTKLLEQIKNETMFKKEKKITWICRKCGFIYDGEEPPRICPACAHPFNYFQKQCEDY